MSINFPEFNHVAEYARYGGIKASLLKKRVAPMYPGELQVIVWPDEAT